MIICLFTHFPFRCLMVLFSIDKSNVVTSHTPNSSAEGSPHSSGSSKVKAVFKGNQCCSHMKYIVAVIEKNLNLSCKDVLWNIT